MTMQKKTKDSRSMSYGQGHGGHTKLPPIKEHEVPPPMMLEMALGLLEPGTRVFQMGECRIFLSPPLTEEWGWHMSISTRHRYPTWDEIAGAWYQLAPKGINGVMVLPTEDKYVNIHSFCFHVWEEGKRRE